MDDITAACNLIASQRLASRGRADIKWIAKKIDGFANEEIKSSLYISVDKKTHNVSFGHSLYYKGIFFAPTQNQRLRCINQHGLENLYKHRESGRKTKMKMFRRESDIIIKKHVESMRNDPESLSIDFINVIMGRQ